MVIGGQRYYISKSSSVAPVWVKKEYWLLLLPAKGLYPLLLILLSGAGQE